MSVGKPLTIEKMASFSLGDLFVASINGVVVRFSLVARRCSWLLGSP